MSVEVEPAELAFRRPFTQEVTEVLRLKNNNADPVAFKVKTTAPKQYCVRPNSGRIESGQVVEVSVLLQAMKEDPPPEFKSRDKFLVQSVAVAAEAEVHNVAAIWSNIEETAKSSIQEKKIRVNFMPPDGFLSVGSATPVRANTHHDLNSPNSTAGTPQQHVTYASPTATRVVEPAGVGEVRAGPYSRNLETNAQATFVGSAQQPASQSSPTSSTTTAASSEKPSALGAAAASVSEAASSVMSNLPSGEDLKSQLEEARAQISRLMSQQTSDSGLRQRKGEGISAGGADNRVSTGNTGMGMRQAPPSGVPVPVVAGLCLLSFLIAYLLF